MHRRVTARRPARAPLKQGRVRSSTDVDFTRAASGALHLGVTLQAEVRIVLDQELSIDRAMRTMAHDTAFAHRLMLEGKRAGLFAVTLGATFVEPRHGQSTRRLENVKAVRVVALDAVDPAFDHRVVLRQVEFGVSFEMTLEAGGCVLSGIHNELTAASARRDMFAAGAVAGFTTALAGHSPVRAMHARMRTRRKRPHVICVTLETGAIAGEACAGNLWWHEDILRNA